MLAYKKRVYSPNRILYPLIREDWDPNGERNVENRGKSKYKRISWDEATTIIAQRDQTGTRNLRPLRRPVPRRRPRRDQDGARSHSCQMLLMEKVAATPRRCENADSWEGWYWGAEHCGAKAPKATAQMRTTSSTTLPSTLSC